MAAGRKTMKDELAYYVLRAGILYALDMEPYAILALSLVEPAMVMFVEEFLKEAPLNCRRTVAEISAMVSVAAALLFRKATPDVEFNFRPSLATLGASLITNYGYQWIKNSLFGRQPSRAIAANDQTPAMSPERKTQ